MPLISETETIVTRYIFISQIVIGLILQIVTHFCQYGYENLRISRLKKNTSARECFTQKLLNKAFERHSFNYINGYANTILSLFVAFTTINSSQYEYLIIIFAAVLQFVLSKVAILRITKSCKGMKECYVNECVIPMLRYIIAPIVIVQYLADNALASEFNSKNTIPFICFVGFIVCNEYRGK